MADASVLLRCESNASSISRLDLSYNGNTSIYSADASSATSTILPSARSKSGKLKGYRLHQRLEKLKTIRRVPQCDPEEDETQSTASQYKRKKKKRKKLKNVVRLQFRRPSRVQQCDATIFFVFYIPPWLILMACVYYPSSTAAILSVFRIFVNIINCIHPVVQALRNPRFRIKFFRIKIRPISSS